MEAAAVVALATEQLRAYNAHDLGAFCACYHAVVKVLDADGKVGIQGIAAFREKYRPMFERGGFGATIDARVAHDRHCVERETWWRKDPETGERKTGTLLVRYTERDGKIAVVEFLR